MRWFPFDKELQTQTVSSKKLHKTLSYGKAACKILVKLRPARAEEVLLAAAAAVDLVVVWTVPVVVRIHGPALSRTI